jgi:hypothetical protein
MVALLSSAAAAWAQRAQPTSTGNPDADRLFVAMGHLAASGKGAAARALLNHIATQHAGTKAGVRNTGWRGAT